MPEMAFVMSPGQSWFLRELVATLQYELERQQVPSALHTSGFPAPRPDLVYALPEPGEYLAVEGPDALPDDSILRRTILICAQRPEAVVLEDDVELWRKAGAVFALDVRMTQAMRRAGIPARTLRPGYSVLRDRFDPNADRPIDVIFYGTHSLRRTRHLRQCARVLARHNCLIQIADDRYPNATGSTSFLAESKWDALGRAKLLVNLHRDQGPHLEWLRALEAIHAGAVLVTEHSSGLAPLEPGKHVLVSSPESLPFVIEAALRGPERLARLRSQAHERLSTWLPFALSVSVLRAAAVEVVGHPVPGGVSLGDPPTGGTASLERWTPTRPAEPRPRDRAIEEELSSARLDVVELRQQMQRLGQLVQRGMGDGTGASVRVIGRSPAWSAHPASRLSVVTVLHNAAECVRGTLDSLAKSWLRDFELILVDAGSSDDSRETASGWIRAHPRVPSVLLGLAINRGLGVALNTALDFARTPLCLWLDPGTELYPRCLEVLTGTLDAMPGVAFVYPIVEHRGRAVPQALGDDYLGSFFGWEPGRLRLGNFIESPALIRAARLRELGGFVTDPRLHGWEPYELWCRIAERGWPAQLVPQILARRSTSQSKRSVPPRFELDALIERVPELLAEASVG